MANKRPSSQAVKRAISLCLRYLGEEPKREGLAGTPDRVVRAWGELFAGYSADLSGLRRSFTEGACNEMVVLKGIGFYSTCEHHLLPFFGQVHIGYLPRNRVLGVSKLARVVEVYSRRLQIQERMTAQIADLLVEIAQPFGLMVVCEAQHLCMTARGVQKQEAVMVTSAIRGSFSQPETRAEFLRLIGK